MLETVCKGEIRIFCFFRIKICELIEKKTKETCESSKFRNYRSRSACLENNLLRL
jgi:hypothetical protein